MGLVVGSGVGGDGGPVIVAVVAAVADQGVIGIQSPGRVVLHQRQTLGHGGAHFGAVHHLQPVGGVVGHHLRQVEMITHLLVGHGGFQQ